jgi:hypothetical protein
LKFFSGKRGLAIAYASFFAFFLFFSIPIGGVFLTLRSGDTFSKLGEIMSNKPTDVSHAAGQFRIAFLFILFMILLTGFMYILVAKSRDLAFRFFTIIFGSYTIIALGYKVIVSAALTTAISKLDSGPLKTEAPNIAKVFINNFVYFGIVGALLSVISLIIGLTGKTEKES